MDSSRRSEPQQLKSIPVLRHPVFLGSKPQENGVLGLRRACPTRLANEDGRAVLESNARGFGRMVGKPYFAITSRLPVIRPKQGPSARIGDHIVRTARNRALPSATRS